MIPETYSEQEAIETYYRAMKEGASRRRIILRWLLWRIDNSKHMAINRRLRELDAIESEFRAI